MDYQTLALTHMFNYQPNKKALMTSEGIKPFDRRPFSEDNWIFQGTENDVDPIIEDIFDSIGGKDNEPCGIFISKHWTMKLSLQYSSGDIVSMQNITQQNQLSTIDDYEHNVIVARKCKSAYPLSFGEIGAVAIAKKFKEGDVIKPEKGASCQQDQKIGQLTRQIWEDCSYSGGSVRIPQLTQAGACTIPSQYRPENIAKFAGVTFKQAVGLSRIYNYLDFDFNMAVKVNKAIRNRTVKNPWDIKLSKKGLTLIELAEDLRNINIRAELESLKDPQYEDWCHYDDGIFDFTLLDDSAAGVHNELEETDGNEFDVKNMPNEYTYWNQSVIKEPACLRGAKTVKSFIKIRNAILDKHLSAVAFRKLRKYIRKFTPSQKREIDRACELAQTA